jgi:malate/lactate dehydrogenase
MHSIGRLNSKVFLIAGVGRLGSQIAMMSAAVLEPKKLILYDIKDLSGDIMDLRHACGGLELITEITEKIGPSDYVIIAAGRPRREKKDWKDSTLYRQNLATVFEVLEVLQKRGAFKRSTSLIIMTNPVLKISKAVSSRMNGYRVYNPEEFLMRLRGGKELGWKIVKTKGYTDLGAAVSCIRLIEDIEKSGGSAV